MRIDAYIFDCDGTLTDSMPLHYVAWRDTMQRHGITFTEDRFYALAGVPTDKIIALLSQESGIHVDITQVTKEKENAFVEQIALLKDIPQVTAVVRRTKGHVKLAVASGGYRDIILQQINQIGLNGFFDAIVTAEDTTKHKPEPDVFLEAAKRLGVDPQYCCVYEDADLGIEAAKRAGMQWVDIRSFHTPKRMS